MTSVVVTGTGLLTAAGLGAAPLEQALAAGRSFARQRSDGLAYTEVAPELLYWPEHPAWQASLEFAGRTSQLAVTACQQALLAALQGAAPFDPDSSATIAVAGDDWTEQAAFDRALTKAPSAAQEARALFSELDDQFLLRTFRWGVSYAIGALTSFEGPSVGVDSPSFGGLLGLRHALDLLESREVDAVMLVGVDSVPRLDVVAMLERSAREAGAPAPCFGQGAAALMLERSVAAEARGARALARVLDCELLLHEDAAEARARVAARVPLGHEVSSAGALGSLLNSGALTDLCLACAWLEREGAAGRAAAANVRWTEHHWSRGASAAVLGALVQAGASA